MTATPNLMLPGNSRYQPKELVPIFGYDNLYRSVAEVELAVLETLGDIGIIPTSDFALLTQEHKQALLGITTTQVDEREKVTRHDIRAWVQLGQEILPLQLRRWLHVPLTSYDALDTARQAIQFFRAHRDVVGPLVDRLMTVLAAKVEGNLRVVQIGRTHGQHALPITVAFWLATLLSRILTNTQRMDQFSKGLVGKISGAVGAYNAQVGLGISARCGDTSFEERVLGRLGLKAGTISTQILPPEPLAYYLFSATMMSAALAQLGRDCRHLMRTEIGEISEPFGKHQVGSSTMAHKRNPIVFESVEGAWLRTKNEFGKVLDTAISDHQRDLVGSSVARDFPIILVNLVVQLGNLLRAGGGEDKRSFIERIRVDTEACDRNFAMQAPVILAEPLYIALQMAGYEGDAHDLVNHQAMNLVRTGKVENLFQAVWQLAELNLLLDQAMRQIPGEVIALLNDPRGYTGMANEKAMEVCDRVREYLPGRE